MPITNMNGSNGKRVIFLIVFYWANFLFAQPAGIGLTVSQTSYGGEPQIAEQGSGYLSATPTVNITNKWGLEEEFNQTIRFDGLAVLPMSQNADIGVAIPEVFYQVVPRPGLLSFSVGRKLERWSELDSYWNLGLWQPLVRWDAASPIEQGLTGLFFEIGNRRSMHAVFMVSGIFLPDQQPDFKEENGRLVSSNRWFRAPVSSVSLQVEAGDINYDVIIPDYRDVIRQNSYAATFVAGDMESGFFAKGSLTDKPANQFHLGIDTEKILSLRNIDFNADIYPIVVRHKLYSIETGYSWEYSRLLLSTNWEGYEKPNVKSTWQQTELIDSRYDGIIFKQDLSPLGINRSSIGLSYVRRGVSEGGAASTFIKGDIEASTQRFAFEEMAGFQLNANVLRTYKYKIDTQFKYVYSIKDAGEWAQAGVQLQHGRNWTWGISGDIFGVPEGSSPSSSFISKYRGNDRLSGSLTYVF